MFQGPALAVGIIESKCIDTPMRVLVEAILLAVIEKRASHRNCVLHCCTRALVLDCIDCSLASYVCRPVIG